MKHKFKVGDVVSLRKHPTRQSLEWYKCWETFPEHSYVVREVYFESVKLSNGYWVYDVDFELSFSEMLKKILE